MAIRQGQRSCGSRRRGTRSSAQAGGSVSRRRRRRGGGGDRSGLERRAHGERTGASLALVWAQLRLLHVSTRPSAASSCASARSRASRSRVCSGTCRGPSSRAKRSTSAPRSRSTITRSMLTTDENIVNVALVVQFRRTDPQSFLFNLRDPEATLEAATASAIREVIGRNVLDFILTDGRAEVSRADSGSAAGHARLLRRRRSPSTKST